MTCLEKIVLHCPLGYDKTLDPLIERLISDGVKFIGVVGPDCERIEDLIDELVAGDLSRVSIPEVLTSSHPGASVSDAIHFAESLTADFAGPVQLVEFPITTTSSQTS